MQQMKPISNPALLERILSRTAEDGDCLLWTGHTNGRGHPKLGKLGVRRTYWTLTRGELGAADLVTCSCGNPACLTHLEKTNRSKVATAIGARPDVKARRISANRRSAAYRPGVKLSFDLAREIRASDERTDVLMRRYRCSRSTIYKVRHNLAWKDTSPFAGLVRGVA